MVSLSNYSVMRLCGSFEVMLLSLQCICCCPLLYLHPRTQSHPIHCFITKKMPKLNQTLKPLREQCPNAGLISVRSKSRTETPACTISPILRVRPLLMNVAATKWPPLGPPPACASAMISNASCRLCDARGRTPLMQDDSKIKAC
jgi:hypothetical protein